MTTDEKKKSARSKDDLLVALSEQIELLKLGCKNFDLGDEIEAKNIAVRLRVLLHQTKQSHALLDQLRLRNGYFVNTAHRLRPENSASDFALTSVRFDSMSGAKYVPLLASRVGSVRPSKRVFSDWWSIPVIKDQRGNKFCRRDLVLAVSNQDGGAHIDPTIDEAYRRLTRENSLLMFFSTGPGTAHAMGNPVLASIRQIAFEVDETLRTKALGHTAMQCSSNLISTPAQGTDW
ncbi:hypothetical protein WL57_03835 [Burkholderia cepacia]|uniref:hypothetical protein n=1 Tax=Burkholderia cepacia TaxID=292 RepID=UPI000755B64A|nr:hypothetical protein [Burkholderia cepacia]KWC93789.1 hypothetical protein WL57_03835 [Burkholderia cepacia]